MMICLTIFQLYWFNIVKLKGNTRKKNTSQKNKIKRFERREKKRAQNKHKTFQEALWHLQVFTYARVNSCVFKWGES